MEDLYKYFMHCPQLLMTAFFFWGAGSISFLFHIVKNRRSFSLSDMFNHCVPFDILHSKSFHMDIKMNIIHAATDSGFRFPGVALTVVVSNVVCGSMFALAPYYTAVQFGYFAASICVIAILLAVEFSDYVVHYAEHKIPILWELHKVHHSADFINPLTSRRGHSIALVYSGILSGIIVGTTFGMLMFLFNISFVEAMVFCAFQNKIGNLLTLSPLKHSHIPVGFGWFDKIFISPHMHQVHHSRLQQHLDKNFGNNLSIFDWLFDTGYKPAKGEKVAFGMVGYSEEELQRFNTLFGSFVSPLLKIGDRIWRAVGFGRGAASNNPHGNDGGQIPAVKTEVMQLPRMSISLDQPTMVIRCHRDTRNEESGMRNVA
jgi:sterol desaturase/sphingolipid hydroxylase (fatty acid hydroxylase superfamily)